MDDLEVKALAIDWQEAVKTAIYDDKRRIDEVRHFRHIPAYRSRSLPPTLPLLPPLSFVSPSPLTSLYRPYLGSSSSSMKVVGLFVYAAEIQADGRHYKGQGSIKRYLTDLLLRDSNVHVDFGDLAANQAKVAFPLHLTSDQRTLDLDLELHFEGPQVLTMIVRTRTHAETTAAVASLGASPNGPKWETDDGRVVQKIWQETDCFAIGNTFLLEKMEITTDRFITIIDQNVRDLYGEKIDAWCAHNGLKHESIIAPGNEDQKTIENMMYMLDGIKKIDPLRRSEPILAIGGGVLTDVAGFAAATWRRGIPWQTPFLLLYLRA